MLGRREGELPHSQKIGQEITRCPEFFFPLFFPSIAGLPSFRIHPYSTPSPPPYSGSYAAFSRFIYPIITPSHLWPQEPLYYYVSRNYRPYLLVPVLSIHASPLPHTKPLDGIIRRYYKTLQVTRQEWNSIIRRRRERASPSSANYHFPID